MGTSSFRSYLAILRQLGVFTVDVVSEGGRFPSGALVIRGYFVVAKICIILIFIGVVVGVGIYTRQHTKNVDGFVLVGRNVVPWLSEFAFGTSYF